MGVYQCPNLCVRLVKALLRLCECADLSVPSLLVYAISTKISQMAQFIFYIFCLRNVHISLQYQSE